MTPNRCLGEWAFPNAVDVYGGGQQSLAADGAIACSSSNFFQPNSDAHRAPQLKAGVILRRLRLKSHGALTEDELRVIADL